MTTLMVSFFGTFRSIGMKISEQLETLVLCMEAFALVTANSGN